MRDKGFSVRRALGSDCDAIAEAHVDSIRSLGAEAYDQDIVDIWGAPRSAAPYRRAMDAGEAFFVATEIEPDSDTAPRIIGFSSYRFEEGRHLTAVYVCGGAARRGVGTALLAAAEDAARLAGARKIDVHASLAAVEFYKLKGFRELGRGTHVLGSGRQMACVYMRKDL